MKVYHVVFVIIFVLGASMLFRSFRTEPLEHEEPEETVVTGFIVWTWDSFQYYLLGPEVSGENCEEIDKFIAVYGLFPFDFDGDNDVDLRDSQAWQNGYKGTDYRWRVN